MSSEGGSAGVAERCAKGSGGTERRRSAARRTAWLLAALALAFYLLFYFLGVSR